MTILQPSEWGGDLELRLLAIGIQRDIILVTSDGFDSRLVSHHPGGIFISQTCNELCEQ